MADQFFLTYPEGHPQEGQEVTRERTCECGVTFTQRIFSERFLSIFEAAHAIEATVAQVPGLWVPVHCPACERKEIRQRAYIAGVSRRP